MSLTVKIAFEKAELLYQEDSLFTVTLRNAGAQDLQVADPATVHSSLVLKTIDAKSGVERLWSVPREGLQPPPKENPLPPGKTLERAESLQRLAALSPGEYEISVLYTANAGALKAESNGVRVKIAPTTPRNLVLDSVQLDVPSGFWVHLGEDGPRIVRARFDTRTGEVKGLLRVAKAGLKTLPVPSRPPNGVWVDGHWVAWIEGGDVFAAHADARLGVSAPLKLALPPGESALVHPLYTDPPAKPDVRPAGALLLLVSTPGRDGFRLLPCSLGDRASAGAAIDVPGPAPAWIASFARSDKRRLVVFAQEKGGIVTLSTLPWTGGAPRKLAELKGEFAGAGVTADLKTDLLRGSVLVRLGLAEHAALERTDFELGAKDEFTPKPAGRIAAPMGDSFTEAKVRLSRGGGVAALLKDQKGQWHVYDGKAPSLLPDPWKTTPYPLDLAFMGGDEPVLVAGYKDAGFRILLPSGAPLPERHF